MKIRNRFMQEWQLWNNIHDGPWDYLTIKVILQNQSRWSTLLLWHEFWEAKLEHLIEINVMTAFIFTVESLPVIWSVYTAWNKTPNPSYTEFLVTLTYGNSLILLVADLIKPVLLGVVLVGTCSFHSVGSGSGVSRCLGNSFGTVKKRNNFSYLLIYWLIFLDFLIKGH